MSATTFPSGVDAWTLREKLREFEIAAGMPTIRRNWFQEGVPSLISTPDMPWADAVMAMARKAQDQFAFNTYYTTGAPMIEMQDDIVRFLGKLLHLPEAAGVITSGGHESNFLALASALAKTGRRGSIVFPAHAHFSFPKASRLFGYEAIIPEAPFGDVDVEAYRAAIRDDTIALVVTAGSVPLGRIDPVAAIGEIAQERGIHLHVDACAGGWILPFAERTGYDPSIEPWDFRVPGVSSISLDAHKFGWAPFGISTLLYRNPADLKLMEDFAPYNGTLTGTRGGGPTAAAWTILTLLGMEGLTVAAMKAYAIKDTIVEGIADLDDIEVVSGAKLNVFNLHSTTIDLQFVSDELERRGWVLKTQSVPAPMSILVWPSPYNDEAVVPFVADLRESVGLAPRLGSGEESAAGAHY